MGVICLYTGGFKRLGYSTYPFVARECRMYSTAMPTTAMKAMHAAAM